jgi:hypothetical protein
VLQKAELSYYDRLGVNRTLFAMTELKISSLIIFNYIIRFLFFNYFIVILTLFLNIVSQLRT